jgi:DNA polymerase (family X)
MPLSNAEIANIFEEVADLLEIDGANTFRVRAYRQAAEHIDDLGRSLRDMVDQDEDLTKLPGIGKDLAGAIQELVRTGTYPDLEALRERIDPSLRELLRIPGLGPKKVKRLHDELGIVTLDDLQAAVEQQRLSTLEGFGEKTEARIARELEAGRTKKARRLWANVEKVALELEARLAAVDGVEHAIVAGSFRRKRDTVGDLDVLVATVDPEPAIESFVTFERATQVTGQGDTRAAIVLRDGLAVDLRVVAPDSFGAALFYFTGSKDHNVVLRQWSIDRGWKMNEYGVYDGETNITAGFSEEQIYALFNLPYIEPELREHRGEYEAAQAGTLPNLIVLEDIRGDIHAHSTWSDGKSTIEEMAGAALAKGYEYMAICDHSPRLAMTHGLDAKRLREQAKEIQETRERVPGIAILQGNEVDILKDGSLDQPDEVMAELDIVIASVHSYFDLSREEQTERLLRAIENPYVQIIGHPQGRLLTKRDGIALDLEKVFTAARDAGVAMEINADPHRLDLDDRSARFAREIGVKFVINTDAHRTNGYDLMRFGIFQARRGWLEAKDVLNTLPLAEFRAALRPKPGAS